MSNPCQTLLCSSHFHDTLLAPLSCHSDLYPYIEYTEFFKIFIVLPTESVARMRSTTFNLLNTINRSPKIFLGYLKIEKKVFDLVYF